MLGIHRSTLWRWLDMKKIPQPRRISGRTLWAREEIELFAQCESIPEFTRLRRSGMGQRRGEPSATPGKHP